MQAPQKDLADWKKGRRIELYGKKSGEGGVSTKKNVLRVSRSQRLKRLSACLVIAAGASAPAYAQIAQVTTVMTNVQTVLTGVAVVLFTIAILWAGFKMAFQHAKWSEISNIVIGGILVGGAAAIAAWLI